MNTKQILMLAGGAIAGYLIYDNLIKKNGGTNSFANAGGNACPYAGVRGCPSSFKDGTGGCKRCMDCIGQDIHSPHAGTLSYESGVLKCNGESVSIVNPDGTTGRPRLRRKSIKR